MTGRAYSVRTETVAERHTARRARRPPRIPQPPVRRHPAHERFETPDIPVFAAPDPALDELARGRLARFEVLTLITAGTLRAAGLEIIATFRRPHHTVLLPDLGNDLRRLLSCDSEIRPNRHRQQPT